MNNILIVGKDSIYLKLLYNYLHINVPNLILTVVVEKKESYYLFLKRRIKKNGIVAVMGQLFFIMFIAKPQAFFSRSKINTILTNNGLDLTDIPSDKIVNVKSINSNSFHDIIIKKEFTFIILCGSRIVSRNTLDISNNRFINIHSGITPFYRGVHGLYWALYNGETNKGGVTLHFVDSGIDTGGIISQKIIHISQSDNFTTYPYLQFCVGIRLLVSFLNSSHTFTPNLNNDTRLSKLYYHPTFFQYLKMYFIRKIK